MTARSKQEISGGHRQMSSLVILLILCLSDLRLNHAETCSRDPARPCRAQDSGAPWVTTPCGLQKSRGPSSSLLSNRTEPGFSVTPYAVHPGVWVRAEQSPQLPHIFKYQVYNGNACQEGDRIYTSYYDTDTLIPLLTVHRPRHSPTAYSQNGSFEVMPSPRVRSPCFTHEFKICARDGVVGQSSPPVANYFVGNTQRTVVNNLIGITAAMGPTLWYKYIRPYANPVGLEYQALQKGHLVPNADFDRDEESVATFLYLNAVPQWATINSGAANGGNWYQLEKYVRLLTGPLDVFTGTSHDLPLQLPVHTAAGVETPGRADVFLNSPRLPVPKFIWKGVRPQTGTPATPQNHFTVIVHNDPFQITDETVGMENSGCSDAYCLKHLPDFEIHYYVDTGDVFCCPFTVAEAFIRAIDDTWLA